MTKSTVSNFSGCSALTSMGAGAKAVIKSALLSSVEQKTRSDSSLRDPGVASGHSGHVLDFFVRHEHFCRASM